MKAYTAACVALLVLSATTAAAQDNIGFWNWHEATVDTTQPECQAGLFNLLGGTRTGPVLSQNGRMFLSTNYMFLCKNSVSADMRRFNALPDFMQSVKSKYGVSVDLLFSQSSDSQIPNGVSSWLAVAIPFTKSLLASGAEMPHFRFDVEYAATSKDAERVLGLAVEAMNTVTSAFGDTDRPQVSWAVNTAAILDLPSSYVTCPSNQANMTIADCFNTIVDAITVMDYRSFAVKEPMKNACDGIAVRGAPFMQAAINSKKRASIAVETSCDLGSPYQFKLSFCAKGQLKHTSDPLQYMYQSLNDTRNALTDTTKALTQYPCAGNETAPIPSLQPGQNLWLSTNVADPAFVIEDAAYFEYLAYDSSVINDRCPLPPLSWQSCL